MGPFPRKRGKLPGVPTAPLSILAVEPWLGGSHQRFLLGWKERSEHSVQVLGLPARHWRWRMQGGAFTLAQRARELEPPDVLVVSDFLDLPRFRGFLPPAWAGVPAVLYLHENQLTYPLRPGEERRDRDLAPAFSNLLSCLAAETVVFNSSFHRDEFWAAARELLSQLPTPRPTAEFEDALARARVVWPGVDLAATPLGPGPDPGAPLRVLFNHRWEHDKDPAAFLRAVRDARGRRVGIELVLLGESYRESPPEVDTLLEKLAPSIVHLGWAADRAEYLRLLGSADLVTSTARHEFYGMALLEGVAAGATPLAPRRLAYPEVLAEELHAEAFFADEDELVGRLVASATDPGPHRDPKRRAQLRATVGPHDLIHTAASMDELAASLAGGGNPRG
jgi:glycosyltransferase involved in cell wall biosynthesis